MDASMTQGTNYCLSIADHEHLIGQAEARANTLGIMHTAIIETPDEKERRIVNSTMFAVGDDDTSQERQQEFVATEKISQKVFRS